MLPKLLPMLAVPAEPFDSPEYCFECKWDGIRVLAALEKGGWQLWGREQGDYTARYPELDVLRRLPAGTLVDGELVALDAHGRPDLPRRSPARCMDRWTAPPSFAATSTGPASTSWRAAMVLR